MMSRSSSTEFTCGLDAALRIISGKWKPLLVYFLLSGPQRYGELKRAARTVSDKVLIQHLKELEADQVVLRTDYREIPPRVDYALTPLGLSLAHALAPLCEWGTANMTEVASALTVGDQHRRLQRSDEPDSVGSS